jgi:hypothetical protein
MYYVGGVLRAIENHTLVPAQGDVPYGTLTYFLSYVVTTITIPFYLLFFKFNIEALKVHLVEAPYFVYFVLRITSATLSLVILYFVNKLLNEVTEIKTRLFLLILLFTNLITMTILHTGKMWVASVLLVIVSFYYLYKSVTYLQSRDILLSIVFSFLAFSNFPLNIYSLVNIPILLYSFRKDNLILKKIIKYIIFGFLIYLCITLFNFAGIKGQIISIFTEYHPISEGVTANLNFLQSFKVYFLKLLNLFSLLILVLLLSFRDGIKNKKLFTISLIYFLCYFFIIILVANWATDFKSSLRYLFPLGFFLIFLVASFSPDFKKYFYAIGFISIVFFVFNLYYLSSPTTYNKAYDWVNTNLGSKNVLVINEVPELQLIKNKESSLLMDKRWCSTKCQNIIQFDLNKDFKPIVVDPLSKNSPIKGRQVSTYFILDHISTSTELYAVATFYNGTNTYHSIDYNLGNYWDLSFFKTKNFGKSIYIYKN